MSILFGFLLPIILFSMTLPLKLLIKVVKKRLSEKKKEGKLNKKGTPKKPLDLIRSKTSKKSSRAKSNKKLDGLSIKALEILLMSLQMLKALLSTIKSIITLLFACLTIFTLFLLLIIILLVVLLVVVISSTSSGLSSGGIISTSNGGGTGGSGLLLDNSTWISSCESMAKWYSENVTTYCGNNPSKGVGKRKGYECPLLDGKTVGDDCSSFVTACLAYADFFNGYDGVNSAPNSSSYKEGRGADVLTSAGFTKYFLNNTSDLSKGDIVVKDGHVEIFVGIDSDGRVLVYSWGDIYKEQPHKTYNSQRYASEYTYYWRLENDKGK